MQAVRFRPIETRKIYKEITDQILSLIRSGEIKRGDQLPSEAQLTEQFGVSRSSVREALKALEVLSVLESRPGVGSFVKQDMLSDSVVSLLYESAAEGTPLELMEARMTIEPQTAALAALRRTDSELVELRRSVSSMEELNAKGEATDEVDLAFHSMLASVCKNVVLADCMRVLMRRLHKPFWKILTRESLHAPGLPAAYIAHHHDLLDAIEKQDAARASQVMRTHLEVVESRIEG